MVERFDGERGVVAGVKFRPSLSDGTDDELFNMGRVVAGVKFRPSLSDAGRYVFLGHLARCRRSEIPAFVERPAAPPVRADPWGGCRRSEIPAFVERWNASAMRPTAMCWLSPE